MKEGSSKKPQADDKGLNTLLGSTKQTSTDIIPNDDTIASLIALGQGDKLRQFKDTFTIQNGDSRSDIIDTTGKVALILSDNQHQPANLGIYTPNSDAPIEVTDPTHPCAFIIGNLGLDSDWYAVKDIAESIALYEALTNQGQSVTILASVNPFDFNKMVRHFAEVKQVTVMVTLDKKDQVTRSLLGVNVKAIITTFDLLLSFNNGQTLDDVLNDPDTIIKDMLADAWGKLGNIADPDSTPTPYPIDAWNGLLKNVILAVAHYAQVPLAMAGQCILGAIAHIGQQFVNAPHGDRHNPASLILVTEGESGSGKTETMNLTHLKIDEHEKRQYQLYLTDLETWEKDKASLTGKERQAFLDSTPKPYNPETVFKDATIETILDKYVNLEIINASWATDDAAQFFNGHSMTSKTAGNALTSFTDLYSGGVVNRSRSQKNAFANPRTKAFNARLTLMLMAQRIILEPALSDPLLNGQGFLARALIACPEDLRGYRTWNDPKRKDDKSYNNPHLIAYWSRCESLLNPSPANLPIAPDGEPERIKIQWADNKAKQVFDDHKQAIENRQRKGGVFATLKAYASRMAENASRIASLIAFFDGRTTITIDDVTRAYLLVEYSTAERLRYLDATPQGEQNDSEKLIGWLVKYCNRQSVNQLAYSTAQSKVSPKHLRKKHNFELIAEVLESEGYIKIITNGRARTIQVRPELLDPG